MVNMLSIAADISTVAGVIIASITICNYYCKEKEREKYDIKKHFYDGYRWDCIDHDQELENFTLIINNAPFFRMSGDIEYSKTKNIKDIKDLVIEDILNFDVKKSNTKEIIIEIYKFKETSDINISKEILGMATLKYITPHEFTITFNHGCLPNFPRTATIKSYEYYMKRIRQKRIEAERTSS